MKEYMKNILRFLIGKIFIPNKFLTNYEIPIFMFHRVLDENVDGKLDRSIFLSKNEFESILNIISMNFDIICLKELLKGNFHTTKSSCIITFDDGWIDTYRVAFPVLKKYGIPATVFLSTDFVGTSKKFWFDRLSELINHTKNTIDYSSLPSLKGLINLKSNRVPIYDKKDIYFKICSSLKLRPQYEIEKYLEKFKQEINFIENENLTRSVIDWGEIREMGDCGITFGSHCVSHSILTPLKESDKVYEIVESRGILLSKKINYVDCLSFPNGQYDQESLDIAFQAGYLLLLSASINKCGQGDSPILAHRINISSEFIDSKLLISSIVKAKVMRKIFKFNKFLVSVKD